MLVTAVAGIDNRDGRVQGSNHRRTFLRIEVYLDESLKRFETVYPAAGDDHSAVRLTIPELEKVSGAKGWVDVCREPEDQQHE